MVLQQEMFCVVVFTVSIFYYTNSNNFIQQATLKNMGNGSEIDETTGVKKEYLGRKVLKKILLKIQC